MSGRKFQKLGYYNRLTARLTLFFYSWAPFAIDKNKMKIPSGTVTNIKCQELATDLAEIRLGSEEMLRIIFVGL